MGTARALFAGQVTRERRAYENLCAYEGDRGSARWISDYLTLPDFDELPSGEEIALNDARNVCHSLQAKIAGRQRPKPQFLTTGADWSLRQRARRMDRFVEAQMHQPQGEYANAWELMCDVFLDAEVFGTGCIKGYADADAGRCRIERVLCVDLAVDAREARTGAVRSLFQRQRVDKDLLVARFPESAHSITLAGSPLFDSQFAEKTDENHGINLSDMVDVIEAWHLPGPTGMGGRHVIAISGTVLVDEPWHRSSFPFAFIRWQRERTGFWSKGIIDEVRAVQDTVNKHLRSMDRAIDNGSHFRVYYREGSIDPKDLDDTYEGTMVPVAVGAEMPQTVAANPVSPQQVDLTFRLRQLIFEQTGASQASATSRKESGVTAGVALRTLNDMETERFSVVARRYEQLAVDIARLMVASTRELAEEDPDFAVRWPGGAYLREYKWSKCNLEEDMYKLTVFPVSSLPSSPAGRLATVQEMIGAQLISPDAARELLAWPDIERHEQRENAEREWLDRVTERFLEWEPGEDFPYESPESFINIAAAMKRMAGEYMLARIDDAPDTVLEGFRSFIEACVELLKRAAQQEAPPQAPGLPAAGPMAPAPMGVAA